MLNCPITHSKERYFTPTSAHSVDSKCPFTKCPAAGDYASKCPVIGSYASKCPALPHHGSCGSHFGNYSSDHHCPVSKCPAIGNVAEKCPVIGDYAKKCPAIHHGNGHHSFNKAVAFNKDEFQATIDVSHFQPNEISVKTVDNEIVIEGEHKEKDDGHGAVERKFVRKYWIPEKYDINAVESSLSSDGILIVKAPRVKKDVVEKSIPITHTQKPALTGKDSSSSSPAVKSK